MMAVDWQEVAAAAIVLAALLYLAQRLCAILTRRRAAGCGSCAACPGDPVATPPQIVEIAPLGKPASPPSRR
jgi:hypothetical protein